MVRGASKGIGARNFWRDVCISGGQVTFGVASAIWFIPPFDNAKTVVLLTNIMATVMFIYFGFRIAEK